MVRLNFFEKHGVIKCHTTFVARTELQPKILKESDWNLIWQTVEKWSIGIDMLL